jgi:cellulose synthase/poly-beta-1,6-N-acetylglucosamine synthase-like glycosyltransferase
VLLNLIEVGYWCCAAGVVYAYALYPPLIYLCAQLFGRTRTAPEAADADLPSCTLLISAHNEEAVIERRILNALETDYPADRLEIVIASDGSDDQTAAIIRRYAPRVRLLEYTARRGKAATINAAMAVVRGEIVILSDANTSFDPAAARALARWFREPGVETVCGRLVLIDPTSGRNADGLYWRCENFLKRCEGELGGLPGSNGAIYAIRRRSFEPIGSRIIVDDMVIPLLAQLRSGAPIIYDATAVAYEETAERISEEFRRRVRIGAGGFQAIGVLWRLLDPRRRWIAFTFLSHKVVRWLCPFFLLGMLAGNAALLRTAALYRWSLLIQLAVYSAAALVGVLPGRAAWLRPVRLATMFTSMNAALLVGFFRWLRGTQSGAWQRTARPLGARGAAA